MELFGGHIHLHDAFALSLIVLTQKKVQSALIEAGSDICVNDVLQDDMAMLLVMAVKKKLTKVYSKPMSNIHTFVVGVHLAPDLYTTLGAELLDELFSRPDCRLITINVCGVLCRVQIDFKPPNKISAKILD